MVVLHTPHGNVELRLYDDGPFVVSLIAAIAGDVTQPMPPMVGAIQSIKSKEEA